MTSHLFSVNLILLSAVACLGLVEIDDAVNQLKADIESHGNVVSQLNLLIENLGSQDAVVILDQAKTLFDFEVKLDKSRQKTYGILNNLFKQIQADKGKLPEQVYFDHAIQKQGEAKWAEAFELLMKSWAAYNESESQGGQHTVDLIFIFEWLEYVAFKLDKIEEALATCQQALLLPNMNDFHRGRFEVSVKFYDGILAEKKVKEVFSVKTGPESINDLCLPEKALKMEANLAKKPDAICRLSTRGRNPLLLLSPVKEEILSVNPPIVFFHDIVTRSENNRLRELSIEKFNSAQILSHQTNKNQVEEETRKAKVAWLEKKPFRKLTQRLEAITKLETSGDGAETYQVSRYETGGFYISHYDLLFEVAKNSSMGDRIATLLIYLNDVEEGGATVFSKYGLQQKPEEGGALFWYNLYRNETSNMDTLHAACPVKKGHKIITNLWYRIRGQFRHKPCGLDENSHFTIESD